MPEAAVHEHRDPDPGKNEVGASAQAGNDGRVDAVAQSAAVQFAAQGQLRAGVPAAGRLHAAPRRGAGGGGYRDPGGIGHLSSMPGQDRPV